MLPKKLRFKLFDYMSLKTMRYVHSLPRNKASGIVAETYNMIEDDFFINGSLTSRSKVPELFAGIWSWGRESMLVSDKLDRTTKEAMTATLSSIVDCPYCGDMLVSLVHAGKQHDDAENIFSEKEIEIADLLLRDRLQWVRAVSIPGASPPTEMPFTEAEIPEAVACLMAMADINRYSHVVMDGSPVSEPLGMKSLKAIALRIFGGELRATHTRPLEPGRSLKLLTSAPLPEDLGWAKANPRLADALSRYAAAIEREASKVVPKNVQRLVYASLENWRVERMPMSRSWVENEIRELHGSDRDIARLALVLTKAVYQCDEKMYERVLAIAGSEENFIRILNWSTFTASRYFAANVARVAYQQLARQQAA
jgi:hypothetical protein